MNNLDNFAAFIRSAAEHLSLSEDEVFQIMVEDDEIAYHIHGYNYSAVMDARNIWNDAINFYKSQVK